MSKIGAYDDGGDCSKNQELSPESPITHVIFEFDGLLMDTDPMYDRAICQMMENYGKTFTYVDKAVIFKNKPWSVFQYLISIKQLPLNEDELASQFKQEYLKIWEKQPPRLMPGAERLIRHLHRSGIPLAIISDSERNIDSGCERYVFEMNTKPYQSLMKLFHHVVLSVDDPEITRFKPDPQQYTVCANRFDQPPKNLKNILLFGGLMDGICSANRAGMTTVWVQDIGLFVEDLILHHSKSSFLSSLNFKPDLFIDSLESFKPQVFGLPSFC